MLSTKLDVGKTKCVDRVFKAVQRGERMWERRGRAKKKKCMYGKAWNSDEKKKKTFFFISLSLNFAKNF